MIEPLFAALYKSQKELNRIWALETITSLTFKHNQSILQVGIDDGFVTNVLSTLVPDGLVTAIEKGFSEDTANSFEAKNIVLINESIDTFNKENSFDKVLAFNFLNETQNPSHSLKNIYKCLKPQGKFTATVLLINPRKSDAAFLKVLQKDRWKAQFNFEEPQSKDTLEAYYQNCLQEAGFVNATIKVQTLSHHFESEADLKEWISYFCKNANLDEKDSKDFVEEVFENFSQIANDEKPLNSIYFSELKIEAKK